ASISFVGGLARGRYRAKVNRSVANLNGTALASDQVWEFNVLGKTTIQGIVHSEDGKPVSGATVSVIGIDFTTTRGADGQFSLPNLVLPFEPVPTLLAVITANGQTLSGRLVPLLVDRGITLAGTVTVHALCDGQFAAGLFPVVGLEERVNAFAIF